MLNKLKNYFGVLTPIVVVFIVGLIILMLFRLGFSFWLSERVDLANGWQEIIVSGLRIDVVTMCYFLLLPALFITLIGVEGVIGKIWLVTLRVWITLGIWLLVYMESVTPPFILEYDLRPNRLFIEYLIYPKEVFAMLWGGYKLELLSTLILSVLTIFLTWKLTRQLVSGLSNPRWYWRPLLAFLVIIIGVMGARSSLGHRPINPAMVAFSSDSLVNDLVLNSSYSALYALRQMRAEKDAFAYYGSMKRDEIISFVRESMVNKTFKSDNTPTLAYHEATYQGKPKNLVILLQESLGAQYVGGLGGLPLTPKLDQLMQEGWNFTRMYATGTRSVRGIEAIVTGFSPTPARAVVKLGKSQHNFFTIAHLLKQKGYHTQFIYGGESHFDNMKSFFLGNGFTDMQDAPTFDAPIFVGSWGVSDEDLYNKAHEQYSKLNSSDKPFFSLVFTSSNHTPYEYPDGRITPYNQPKQTRENTTKYSDYALGEFFKKAKSSNYWEDTVFIVIADHDSRTYGSEVVPIKNFHIPALIIGKDIKPKQDDRLTSQIDMPTTLLSLIGISGHHPMIGHDLTQSIDENKLRAMMQFYNKFAWMDNEQNVVVFQPHKKPLGFSYSEETKRLIDKELTEKIFIKAKANALWGSLAYKEGLYSTN